MTTPRIEEMVERYLELLVIKKTKNPVSHHWLREALTEARQAGKIQALHLLEDLYAKAKDKAELIEMFNEALQDNK